MVKVAVLDDWQGVAESLIDWQALRARAELTFFRAPLGDAEAVVAALADYDIILAMRERTPLPGAVINRLAKLRLISFTGPRNAAIDTAACAARGITVCNTQSARSSHATAELALGLLLSAARRLPQGDAALRSGAFQEHVAPGIELAGRTLGVIGLGRIGARMAGYGRALGMQVLAWSQNLTDARAAEQGVTRVTKEELLARADAISLHLVLSDRSRGVIAAEDIARMKAGAILINTSRAPLIDQPALLAALRAGRITAALDVYDEEPLPRTHPLRTAPNTVLSPHLGYVTQENMTDFYRDAAENIVAWIDGKPIRVVAPA
ncbi:MAG: D-2-hydroxyacid dehydrogenase family protein [Rhodospirillales bacterium]|nr:D-2-hydroxyacid dehydrogenase family protein [Rhodospirillales bacterium]MDE2576551.1 D-2-hydroxyacid dehydrogenase family protein [Rhodospirillales bacterium]